MIPLLRWLYRHARSGPAGTVRLALHQTRYDLTSFLRNRQAVFFTLLLPVLFLVILVGVFGNETVGADRVQASTYYVPGLAAMAVIAACFVNLVVSITTQRDAGILKRRRATPVPAWALIAGRTLTSTIAASVTLTVVLAVGRLGYGVAVPGSALPAVALIAGIGSITFCCLGYAATTLIGSAEAAQPIVQAIVLPLYFISGVFVPDINLPTWLHDVATAFPVQHLADSLTHALDPAAASRNLDLADLLVLTAWGIAGMVIALTRFAWTPRTNSR